MDGITPTVSFHFDTPGAREEDVMRARLAVMAHFRAAEVHPLDALLAAFDQQSQEVIEPTAVERAKVWHEGNLIALEACYPNATVSTRATFWIDWTGGPAVR